MLKSNGPRYYTIQCYYSASTVCNWVCSDSSGGVASEPRGESPVKASPERESPGDFDSSTTSQTSGLDLSSLDAKMQEIEDSLHDLSESTTPTPSAAQEEEEEEDSDSDDDDDDTGGEMATPDM